MYELDDIRTIILYKFKQLAETIMNSKFFSKSLLIIVFSILLNSYVFGQAYEVVVNLINNYPVRGELLEITPDSVAVIEKETGKYLVFQGSEIWSVYIEELNETIDFPISEVPDIFKKDKKDKAVVPDTPGTAYTPGEADIPSGPNLPGNQFELGIGLVEGSEYDNFMDEAYSNPNTTWTGGWIDIEIGYSINVVEAFYLTPRIALLGSRITTTTPGFEFAPNRKANIIILPGISARYYFTMILPSLYTSLGLSLVYPFSDVNRFEFDSGGMSIEIGVGYIIANRVEIEIGYLSVPVKTQISDRAVNDANFGGLKIVLRGKI